MSMTMTRTMPTTTTILQTSFSVDKSSQQAGPIYCLHWHHLKASETFSTLWQFVQFYLFHQNQTFFSGQISISGMFKQNSQECNTCTFTLIWFLALHRFHVSTNGPLEIEEKICDGKIDWQTSYVMHRVLWHGLYNKLILHSHNHNHNERMY